MGKTPKPSDKQSCFHQSLCSCCCECAVLPEVIKQCIKQPYLDWEVWKWSAEQVLSGQLRCLCLRLNRGDLCACVGTMAKSRYSSGLTLPGRTVCLLPNSGYWLLQKRDESVFLTPKLKEDLSQLNYSCPLGRLLRPKPRKTPDSGLNTVLGNFRSLSLICTLPWTMLALFCK